MPLNARHFDLSSRLNISSIQGPKSISTPSCPDKGSSPSEAAGPRRQVCVSQRKLIGELRVAATPPHTNKTVATATSANTTSALGSLPLAHQASALVDATNAKTHALQRHTPKCRKVTWKAGDARMKANLRRDQTRLNTKVPLVPPKPKLFFTA